MIQRLQKMKAIRPILTSIILAVSLITTRGADKDIDTYMPVTDKTDENTFVVIISNENYKKEKAVPFAINDGETFKLYCEKTLGIPAESHIKYAPDASLGMMYDCVDWLEEVMKAYNGEARAIFYYSGHGVPDEDSKQAYLLPVDVGSSSVKRCMSTAELYKRLGAMPSKGTVVFLDACFSGAARNGDMMQEARGVAIQPKHDDISAKDLVVFSAATGKETAYPYKQKKHGMFTYYLLEKLNATGGAVTLGDMSDYVTEQVKRNSITVNKKSQTPTLLASADNGAWRGWTFSATPAKRYESVARIETPKSNSGPLSITGSSKKNTVVEATKLEMAGNKIMVNDVPYEMVRIDKGTFSMGSQRPFNAYSTFSLSQPRHKVTLKAYNIGRTEVPQAIWEAIMGNNPSENVGENLPVENVTWEECQQFIEKLNQQLGTQFRLPTEAEWEYAACCRNETLSDSFSGSKKADGIARIGNSTVDCGSLKISDIGLYDMSGNVAEWCQDYFARYDAAPKTNPKGPNKGFQRVVRGGSYMDSEDLLRSSYRGHMRQNESSPSVGFRLAHD